MDDALRRTEFARTASLQPDVWRRVVCSYERPFIDYPRQEALAEAKRRNQRILAAALDGALIAPGETLSVWKLAGRPTARRGYAHAAALKDGTLTTDIGGAICLLSTVLYNVALLGGLRIVERHAHSVDSYGSRRYFELGRDAAIEHPYRDLRFENPHAVPLQLRVKVDDACVRAELRSAEPLRLCVTLEITDLEQLPAPDVVRADRSLPAGAEIVEGEGIPGLRMRTRRVMVFPDGRRQDDDLGETVHQPQARVVRRGIH